MAITMSTEKNILAVDDERAILEMVEFAIKRTGFIVRKAEDAMQAMNSIAEHKPDLVLLDWMLPDMSGLELTRTLKREQGNEDLGIIMLTARADEYDKVAGLEGGADDYVTKPFAPRELIARIQAVLRRSQSVNDEILCGGVLELDAAGHRVVADGEEIRLGPTEYRLLLFLMAHPDRVYSRSQLLDRVWGANVYVEERTVDVHVRRLRKALAEQGADAYIQTVRGAGYRFSVRDA